MSRSIRYSLKGDSKGGQKWQKLVGYTTEQLKDHLEKQFEPWMNWENHGRDGWHIDHIIPVSAFNFETPEDIDFKRCWALKNLRPLAANENFRKGKQLDRDFQPALMF